MNRRTSGFSLTELLVVLVAVAAILATQIPTNAAARRTARRMQNSTQLRGIHQGLIIFGQSNKFYYPGLNSKGTILENNDANTGSSGDGDTVQARFWILFRGDFFTPEYAISPSEVANLTEYEPGFDNPPSAVQWGDNIKNYSYAMLHIAGDANKAPAATTRAAEWKETANTQAIVMSDRNRGSNATDKVASVHTRGSGDWQGSVLWNDNHVGFEMSHDWFETKYGNGNMLIDEDGWGYDNLFAEDNDGEGKPGADALMVIQDDAGIHGNEQR